MHIHCHRSICIFASYENYIVPFPGHHFSQTELEIILKFMRIFFSHLSVQCSESSNFDQGCMLVNEIYNIVGAKQSTPKSRDPFLEHSIVSCLILFLDLDKALHTLSFCVFLRIVIDIKISTDALLPYMILQTQAT